MSDEATPVDAVAPRAVFSRPRQFWIKTALLAVTTISLIPILLWRDERAATVYVAFLAVIHVVGLAIILIGTKRHDIAPTRRGLLWRVVALVILTGLLYLASQGLESSVNGPIFWGALFSIWALHTLGLAFLHLKGAREAAACPFA